MEKRLHPTQERLLKLLKENLTDPLTVRELQTELGLSSPSVVQHHIQQLEKRGYLRRTPGNPHDYQILADEPEKKITYINLYGLAHCGPHGSILDGNPLDRIPIATRLLGFSSKDAFMVRAKGDSMKPKINDKDLVIAKKTRDWVSGNIVVCVNNEVAIIKKVIEETNNIILRSLNEKYDPFVASDDFRVEGIVKGIISYPRDPQ